MLDLFGIPKATTGDIRVFGPNALANNVGWQTWTKPRGVNMVGIFLVSKGGNGTVGGVGAVSAATGGAGGGSSGQTLVIIPASFLPNVLFLNLQHASSAGAASRVTIAPDATANTCLAIANGGALQTAGAISTIATMPMGGLGFFQLLAGQSGAAGGAAGNAGSAITLPITGLRVTGGSGGGGLGALSSAGFAGGAITGAGVFPTLAGGVGPAGGANTAGGVGNGLSLPIPGLGYYYGGTGGASQSLGGAGAGAGGGGGGNAGPGCGGGGGGAGFTGSTAALGGLGGDSQCTIIAW